LTAGSRTATLRQRTLRGTLDWSYALLSEPERRLFNRLSVFASGWTLQAAEVVGAEGDTKQGDVLDLLSRLVDKSLVVAEATGAGGVRYKLLEPIRCSALRHFAGHYALDHISKKGVTSSTNREE
jgi:predicted ATPase